MKNNDFKGVLVYITSPNTTYDELTITNITNKSPYILDYVILDITADEPDASEVLRVAKDIYAHRPNARFWIGTRKCDSHTDWDSLSSSTIISELNNIKNTFLNDNTGQAIWYNCVKGIYLNMESIYHTINYNVGPSQNNGKSFTLAKELSDYVHNSMDLKFLWIPYYGYNTDAAKIIKNIAYVVACTDIFDIVILQPHYYFDESVQSNLGGVKYSINSNNICYRDGVEVFERTCNNANVGFEMEVGNLASATSDYRERYENYVKTFKGCTNVPMCYYAGNLNEVKYNYPLIGLFFGVIYGDADGDGVLTANDASITHSYALQITVPDDILSICDVDGDGYITANDAACILQKTLTPSFEFPVIEKIYNKGRRDKE